MDSIKLLIVDDVEDNRLVLKAICRKLEGFEIYEAVDGRDAVEQCETLRPNIVLMDVMMPRLDGFQASKIIKERYPETVIMAVTAVIDPKMEENMAAIGVTAYIRKPIDKELIRLKLQSYAGALSIGSRDNKLIAETTAINPFCNEIRNFKTIFHVNTIEAIMDFGVWLLVRFECAHLSVCTNIDMIIELMYELLHQEIKNTAEVNVTIEESFDELFIHVPLPKPVKRTAKIDHLLYGLGNTCMIEEDMIAFRISLIPPNKGEKGCMIPASVPHNRTVRQPSSPKVDTPPVQEQPLEQERSVKEVAVESAAAEQESRSLGAVERQVLRESFANKITAVEYVESIDQDAYGEVSDLREAEEEWKSWMRTLTSDPTEDNFHHFANEVLGTYSNAISALYEFSGLAYAIISLSTLIKANAALLADDEAKRANVLLFLEGFKNDLSSWIEHVFELQDTQDIHYLDGSFFSSCMLIESMITETQIDTGEEGEIEFF